MTNSRLESFDQGQVRFRYRDSRSGQLQRCTLTAEYFIARFLQHVLPSRFTKVRYYGLLSSRCLDDLEHVRSLLQRSPELIDSPDNLDRRPEPADLGSVGSNHHDHACPVCHLGVMTVIAELVPQPTGTPTLRAPPAA